MGNQDVGFVDPVSAWNLSETQRDIGPQPLLHRSPLVHPNAVFGPSKLELAVPGQGKAMGVPKCRDRKKISGL